MSKKANKSRMTAREWLKTPAGKKEMRQRHKKMVASITPQLEETAKMIQQVNKSMDFPAPIPSLKTPIARQSYFLDYDDGNFYVKDKLVDFRDPNFTYVLVLKALWLQSDETGFLSYDAINKYLERSGKKRIRDKHKQIERITNALVSLRRDKTRQKQQFPLEYPDGSPVIRTVPGKGLIISK